MFSSLFKTQSILDEESILWMIDVYAWALRNFDTNVFYNETELVTPTNEHFPGNVDDAEEMAAVIFGHCKRHAGLAHWPFQLMHESAIETIETPKLTVQGAVRGGNALAVQSEQPDPRLVIPYSTELLRDPQVLTATFAHNMAHYLGSVAQEPPPGGLENWPHVTELLAVFMGFGVIMANTAYTTKIRSCASCSGPSVERTNFLSEYDITYALAIFCALKGIPVRHVTRHLKSTLQPFYKKAVKDIDTRGEELKRCPRPAGNT